MTETALRNKIVETAESYHGIREGSAAHRDIVDTYNSILPHPRGYQLTMADPWCAAYVSAMAVKCGLTDIIPVECSCTKMIELLKEMGRWQERDDYIPQPGDILFYDWQDDGKGDNTGIPDHVGIVTACEDGKITVIEGNYQNAVRTREVPVDGKYIRGYGVPDYASMADHKSVDELAREVIAGKWGNGQERKDRLLAEGYDPEVIQDRVNELMGRTYTVKKGDTLWGIAERLLGMGQRYKEIKGLNGLTSDVIYAGQVLKMPEK